LNAQAYNNLGSVYGRLGQLAGMESDSIKVINPIKGKLKKVESDSLLTLAITNYNHSAALDVEFAAPRKYLAMIYNYLGKSTQAAELNSQVEEIQQKERKLSNRKLWY